VSKSEKRLKRLQDIPSDFTWDELVAVLGSCGFRDISDKHGSYRTFINDQEVKICLHKPHPNPVVKKYALRQILDKLKECGIL
jgi:hypothetical protein